jgi:hypothetical protein
MWLLTLLRSKWFWGAVLAATVIAVAVHLRGKYDDALASVARMEQAEATRVENERETYRLQAKNKERTDAENRRNHDALQRELARLRSRPEFVPTDAPPASGCPADQVCYDRAEFQRAYREFAGEVREGAGQCSALAVDLQSARDWANGN